LYASGLALLEQNLHTLDSQGTFEEKVSLTSEWHAVIPLHMVKTEVGQFHTLMYIRLKYLKLGSSGKILF
jgi:hypothetical protein